MGGDNDPTAPRNNNKLLCQLSARKHTRHADHRIVQGQRGRCGHTAAPGDLTEGLTPADWMVEVD